MSQVQRGEESVGCASSGMVGVEKAAKLFLQAGQSGMSKGGDRVWCCCEADRAGEEGWSETMTAGSQTKTDGRESLMRSPLLHFLLSPLDREY